MTRRWPRSFADRLTDPLPGLREVLRIMRTGGFRPADLSDVSRIPVQALPALPATAPDQASITWVGHATFVIRLDGLTILTDPVWSDRIIGVPKRLTPVGLPFSALPPVDAVLISHNHYDHLDLPTLRRLPKDTLLLVPAALAKWCRRRGLRNVVELDWWERHQLREVEFSFVPAHHWSRRTPFDSCASLWGGWMLTGRRHRLYFAGDTGYGHWFGEIGRRYPGIDLALLPIGAYEPNWFMKPMHLNPAEAVQACLDAGATRLASMHWGTFALSREPLLAPPEEARKAWAEAGLPRENLWDLAVGESRSL